MTVQEKLEVLEDILELDEGTLKVEDSLEDIDEWDSMSKLYLVTYVKKEMQKRLTVRFPRRGHRRREESWG